MVMKLVDIISLKVFCYCFNVIVNLHKLKEKICVCYLYQGCLEEYFCEFDAPWTPISYRKKAVPNYCCVFTFVNEYSTLWLHKVKDKPFWLEEFFVWINADLIEITSFGCFSDKKILQDIELLSKEKEKFF